MSRWSVSTTSLQKDFMTTDGRVTSVVPDCVIIFHLTFDCYLFICWFIFYVFTSLQGQETCDRRLLGYNSYLIYLSLAIYHGALRVKEYLLTVPWKVSVQTSKTVPVCYLILCKMHDLPWWHIFAKTAQKINTFYSCYIFYLILLQFHFYKILYWP